MNSKGTARFDLPGMMISFVEVGVVVDDVGAEEAENVMVDFYGEVVPGCHTRLSRVETCLYWTIMIREECVKVPCERESIGLVGRGFRIQGGVTYALANVNWRDLLLRRATCSV